jgi:hypothetical protein
MSESSLGRKAPGGVPREEQDRRKLRDERGAGQALVGRLLKGCLDRGVVPQAGCRGVRLLADGGRVTGVGIEGPDGPFEASAGGGVVLATGGFEHDERLVRAFLRGPLARAVSVPTNTGDGLRMVMRVGADLADMREAWWVPTIDVDVYGWGRVPWQVNTERTRPHTIMVNDDGVRFTNEAANYNALGNAFHVVDVPRFAYVNHPAWLVFDHHYLSRYGLAGHRPPAPTPDRQPALLCRTRLVRGARHQRRAAHGYAGAGAQRRRQRDRGFVRRGQRDGLRHGHDLRRTRRHPGTRIGFRLPVRPSCRRPRRTPMTRMTALVKAGHYALRLSFRYSSLQALKEHRRDAKDESTPIVSQAKTAWIPAEIPAVGVNQVRDGPDQRLFAHTTDVVV